MCATKQKPMEEEQSRLYHHKEMWEFLLERVGGDTNLNLQNLLEQVKSNIDFMLSSNKISNKISNFEKKRDDRHGVKVHYNEARETLSLL